MLDQIKRAAMEAIEAGSPVAIMFGTVTGVDPLEVSVDQRLSLDADFLIVPESLTRYEINLQHAHTVPSGGVTGEALPSLIVIRPGLQQGDRVLLLRMQGGQRYLILDKVVEP